MGEQLLSIEDVSDFLGVPVSTVYQWRSKQYGPPGMKVGRHVRYRRSDLERWLDAQAQPQPAA